ARAEAGPVVSFGNRAKTGAREARLRGGHRVKRRRRVAEKAEQIGEDGIEHAPNLNRASGQRFFFFFAIFARLFGFFLAPLAFLGGALTGLAFLGGALTGLGFLGTARAAFAARLLAPAVFEAGFAVGFPAGFFSAFAEAALAGLPILLLFAWATG